MAKLLIPIFLAVWICIAAIVAIQNAAPVSLQWLTLRSVPIPAGLLLVFSAALGTVGGALLLLLWSGGRSARRGLDEFER